MELMKATINSTDLSDSYREMYNTCAVVGGLIIAFCFSATQVRLEATNSSLETIWGMDIAQSDSYIDFYGLTIGLALVFAFLDIAYAVHMNTMLAQIPQDATTLFFNMTGSARIQIPFVFQIITLFFISDRYIITNFVELFHMGFCSYLFYNCHSHMLFYCGFVERTSCANRSFKKNI